MTTRVRQRMTEDMQIRNLSPLTQSCYVQQVSMFARHFGKSPAVLDLEDIRDYQLYLTNPEKAGCQLDPSRCLGASISLPRYPQTAVGFHRGGAQSQEASDPADHSQSRGGAAFSRLGRERQAADHPDHLLRRQLAHQRGG
jgi:hypothetical protein